MAHFGTLEYIPLDQADIKEVRRNEPKEFIFILSAQQFHLK